MSRAVCKQRSFSAAGQFQCCASQEDRDGESSTLKFWIAGSDARSMGMASPGSAPGYGKVWRAYDKPAIAQLAEHLTVELCSYQMVPDSIPGNV